MNEEGAIGETPTIEIPPPTETVEDTRRRQDRPADRVTPEDALEILERIKKGDLRR